MNFFNGLDKRIRIILVVLLTAIIYIPFFLIVYPNLLAIENTYILFGIVIVLAVISLTYFFSDIRIISRQRAKEKREIFQKLQHYESMLAKETHTFYVLDLVKEIRILNKNGDATVTYSFRCRNNPESELKRVRISVSHDGNLIEDSMKCYVDEQEIKIIDIERLLVLNAKSMKPKESMPNIFNFSISPKESIGKGDLFTYSYTYEVKELFRDFLEPGEEHTSTLLIHPTDCLKYIMQVPEGYVFKSFRVEVFDRDEVEHLIEEQRIKLDCPPYLSKNREILFWEVVYPKLANIYKLCFSAEEEAK